MFQDLRYGVRMLFNRPGFTVLVVLTLALGIGVSMAIFAVVNSILLRPLPYPEPDRLVKIFETAPEQKMYRGFVSPFSSIPGRAQIWVTVVWNERSLTRHGPGGSMVLARLRNRVTIEQARAEMSQLAERLTQAYPKSNSGVGAAVCGLHEEVTRNSRETLLIFLAAALFVLLIACANVAGLMLARNIEREREIAIRSALGASGVRVLRQLLTENLLLSLAGGALGILLGTVLITFIGARIPRDLPRADQITLDTPTLLLTLLTSIFSAVLIGLTPALQAVKIKLTEALKESGHISSESRRSRHWRNTFVVWQIALTLVLLIGAGLLVHSLVDSTGLIPVSTRTTC